MIEHREKGGERGQYQCQSKMCLKLNRAKFHIFHKRWYYWVWYYVYNLVFSPEELIPDDLLAVPHAELRVTDHQHAVGHHHQRDHPVDGGHKHSVEMENEAEVRVTPHPHWKGEAHHADDGEVGCAVQEDHHVN